MLLRAADMHTGIVKVCRASCSPGVAAAVAATYRAAAECLLAEFEADVVEE